MGIALIVCVAVAALPAQAPEPIFDDSQPSLVAGPAAARPYVVRSRTATLRGASLARAMAAPAAAQIALNLFDDATFTVSYERVEDSGFGHRSWVGHITDRPLSTVTLTQKGDIVTGAVTDGSALYEIASIGGGLHRIDELDTTAMPREVDVALTRPSAPDAEEIASPAVASPAAVSTVDIFVYYTSALRTQVGSAEVQNRIAQYVSQSNLAYQRSGIAGQLRLVGFAELAVPDPDNPVSQLNAFSSNATVLSQRDTSQADLVALLVSRFSTDTTTTATCGVGWIGPWENAAFTVTASRPLCSYTFVHEVGHNLGAQHAPEDYSAENPPPGGANYPAYARGYKAPNGAFRTVMAYDCSSSCPRIPNFSAPAILEGGQPTGTALQHNARRLSETFAAVAAHRTGPAPPPPPPPPPQTTSAPRNLAAFTNGANITLSWQPPLSGTPTHYRLAAGTAPGASNIGEVTLTSTQFGPFSLPNGTYYARVYAHNSAGSSLASNELPFAPVVPMAPGPPRSFTGTANGSTVNFTWLPPSTGGAVQHYLLEAGSVSGASNLVSNVAVGGTAASFSGIGQGRYFVRLRARNSAGVSGASNETIVDVGGCSPPSAPQNPRFNKANFDVSVFWDAPVAGGPGLTYILEAGSVSGAANLFNSVVGPTPALSARVARGTYFVRLRARTTCGTGPASGELRIEVP
jgi:peptidyl-Asp metalloendopeptidase